MKKVSFIIITCCLMVVACTSSKKTSLSERRALETVTVSAKNNPWDIYRASEPRLWDITHTRVALSFDLKNRTAAGEAWLRMHPYFFASDSVSLDAKSMDIDSVLLFNGSSYSILYFTYEGEKLNIRFPKKYTHEESIELYVKYTAKPYATITGGSSAITDDRGLYFINADNEIPGKPVQIWTQGETQANSHWLPTLDQPNERMTVQVELTVPDSFKTLSNGALLRREIAGKNLRTDVWAIQQPIQVYAVMFAIGNFAIVEDKSWKGVPVTYYVEPQFAPYAKKMFNNTPEMIAYFSEITGVPYPWNKYSQVVVRDYVSGAMENTTASLFGEFMNQNFREIADKNYEDIVSHELFHQWFGDYVTAESWSNLTVNESFANYGEQLWRKYKYGQTSCDELAFDDLSKYLGQAKYNDEPLVRFHYANREDMFDRISYQKGGAILHYIHSLIGDEAFYKAMNIYLTKNALQPAEAHHWRMAVEEATGLDWNWFFNQWYYRGGHPQLNIRYDYNDKEKELVVNVRQATSDSGRAYILPLKAALIYGETKEIIDWHIDSKKQSFTFPYKGDVKPLFVPDEQHWLVGIIREENKKLSDWLAQLKISEDYINKRRAISTAFMAPGDTIARTIFRFGLLDSIAEIRIHTLSLLVRVPEKYNWHKHLKDEVVRIAEADDNNLAKANAIKVLGSWKNEASKELFLYALNDSSYAIAGAALIALKNIDKDTSYLIARRTLSHDPKAELEFAAWEIIAAKGAAGDIHLFEKRAPQVYGTKKISFAGFLSLYCVNTDNFSSYEKGLKLIADIAMSESIKTYRFSVGAIIFATINYYKEQIASANNVVTANEMKERKALAEKYWQLIINNEKDPENLKKYKSLQ